MSVDTQNVWAPRVVGAAGVALAVALAPPVVGRVFALGPLHAPDHAPLWGLSGVLLVVGLLLALWPGAVGARTKLAALLVPVFALLGVELLWRLQLKTTEGPRRQMVILANQCYPEESVFVAHPFLQFAMRPGTERGSGEDARERVHGSYNGEGGYNGGGFKGPDLPHERAAGSLRIACLGGSTTARGYPQVMRDWLLERDGAPALVEALNFGLSRYSSTHSTINFVLNVLDYSPDYVVFHHAWNDHWGRDVDVPVRGDGSHYMSAFNYPRIPDAVLIRSSLIYRQIKFGQRASFSWMDLNRAVTSEAPRRTGPRYQDLTELAPYERNIRTVTDLALVRGITPVLTTQPHATEPDVLKVFIGGHIDQCNEIMRAVAAEYGPRIVFVDLDRQVTGVHEEFFLDVGHMNDAGIEFKAQAIGQAILEHLLAAR